MKALNGRTQGTWDHPALYEIGKALDPCIRLRDRWSGPCSKTEYIKRDQWCERCVARAALDELGEILKHLADDLKGTCHCEKCNSVRKYLANGRENDRKYGIKLEGDKS